MARSFAAGRLLFFLIFVCGGLVAKAQPSADSEVLPPPKRELRGMWIATVENIDWPNQRGEAPEIGRASCRERVLAIV